MTRGLLINKVALKMDEISSSDFVSVSVGLDDNNPLYTQINGLLNESINDVLSKAPIYRLQNHVKIESPKRYRIIGDESNPASRKVAEFSVPEGFIRLASIHDDLFQRPITELAVEGSDVDKRQHNRFLMAKTSKPVAVIGRGSDGTRIITCYSFSNGDTPATIMSYIESIVDDYDFDADIDIDEYLANIVTWACAGKVFAVQGDALKAKTCDENAMALMV